MLEGILSGYQGNKLDIDIDERITEVKATLPGVCQSHLETRVAMIRKAANFFFRDIRVTGRSDISILPWPAGKQAACAGQSLLKDTQSSELTDAVSLSRRNMHPKN